MLLSPDIAGCFRRFERVPSLSRHFSIADQNAWWDMIDTDVDVHGFVSAR